MAKDIDIKKIEADYILISHGHMDHIADAAAIAKNTGAKVIAAYEVAAWLEKKGVKETHGMNPGGKWTFDFGSVRCTNAIHSSSLPDGSYGANPMGFVIESQEGNFYYSGDTALTMDMKLIPMVCKALDLAILPIGGNYTMGAEDAIMAAEFVNCTKVLGVHYDTFEYIKINKDEVKALFASKNKELTLLNIGETKAF